MNMQDNDIRDICTRDVLPSMESMWRLGGEAYKSGFPDDTSSSSYKFAVLQELPKEIVEMDTSKMVCDLYKGLRDDDTSSGLYQEACGSGILNLASLGCEIYKDTNPDDTTSLGYKTACPIAY